MDIISEHPILNYPSVSLYFR